MTAMAADTVLFFEESGAARITLSRPQTANALNWDAVCALAKAAKKAKECKSRVVILCGEGKHFCAGADAEWLRAAGSEKENYAQARFFAETLRALYELPKPLIALVRGACYGGGAGLAAVADVCAAAPSAKFCFGETRLGLLPATISPYVVAAIGARNARRYFQSAEVLNAKAAKEAGLVSEIAEDLESFARAMTAQFLQNAPGAMSAAKALPAEVAGRKINSSLSARTAALLAKARAGEEAREGLSAFLEKRKPKWGDV